jgi:beta-glucosidase/6-phospho-beta-glucosidase/beta-galactosidase
VDTSRGFDFSTLDAIIEASRRTGLTVIYDLFHFGYPPSLDPLNGEFEKRFTEYCYQVARRVYRNTERACYFTPVNEPSYFAWAAGEMGLFAPYYTGRGDDLKVAVVKAAICGTEAIWAACPRARIVSVDPFCHVISPTERIEDVMRTNAFNTTTVFHSWDMLSGAVLPELGGSPRHLDIVGVNYYQNNQWILDAPHLLLDRDDPRRLSLFEILETVWRRYDRPLIISETSDGGDMRTNWIRTLAAEAHAAIRCRIPLSGICWYPVLEMPEWHAPGEWKQMGLWDLDHNSAVKRRLPCRTLLSALHEAEEWLQTHRQLNEARLEWEWC